MQEPDARTGEKASATDNAATSLGKLALHHPDSLAEEERKRVRRGARRGNVSIKYGWMRSMCGSIEAKSNVCVDMWVIDVTD